MDASTFLTALSKALKSGDVTTWDGGVATWSLFMKGRLLELANRTGMHLCAEDLGTIACAGVAADAHLAKEFLFDVTLYGRDDWNDWSLPSVIIEHENAWTEKAFLQDFWKLLVAFAPLRVMFGYAKDIRGVQARVEAITRHAQNSRWGYPGEVEDVVLLRCPDSGGMKWPTWRVVHRPKGGAWRPAVDLALDGRTVSL